MRCLSLAHHATALKQALQGLQRPTRCQTNFIQYASYHTRAFHSTRYVFDKAAIPGTLSASTQLRPYQEETIKAVLDYLARGERRLGVSLATGGGKTVIFSHLIDRVPAPTPEATQTLIIAHRQELVNQAATHCRNLYPDRDVDIEMGKRAASGYADITIASIASLASADRLSKFDPLRFKLIIVDEAHHMVASSYLGMLDHFGLLENAEQSHVALVGVSATLSRNDGLSLGKALDHIVYHKDYLDMIEGDWLSAAVFTTVRSGVDLNSVKMGRGDFQTGSLSKAVNNPEANTVTVRAWLEKCRDRKSTLVFCVDLAHVAALTGMFRQHGVDAQFITSNTKSEERQKKIEGFRKGTFPVLLNCGILTEGTDIPNIDCIVLARPTRSRNLLVQMIGRGLRKFPGKINCHMIDMVSALDTGIVTTPTLFGLDPDELVDEADADTMKEKRDRRESEHILEPMADDHPNAVPELSGSITFTDYEDINDLIEDTSGERKVRAISPFAWVQVDAGRYVLSASQGDLTITQTDGGEYEVVYKKRIPASVQVKSPFMRPRRIAKAVTFEQAVRAADTAVKEVFVFAMVAKNAQWRSAPASDTQVAFLSRFRDEDDQLTGGSIKKGQAADWITKIKNGAKGRFNRLATAKRKVVEKEEKKQQFIAKQSTSRVAVGPVV
ncbi:putative ATP-dependent helicase IRC3 [Recurvomyces mirabilis]|uniref:ATP-dependent helicase IRC3 n=1 Tax=Recurvomyces mirabilis TaxID=574656 RepID=A0AAE0TPM1_9PEZI|nr:putative ATP-dependent helicase IRC3 [Recurvomyces mirabilis]KAK5156160.1 putative ATP-dependent helicase IRC3 [Recurvomyces mirabilis]